MRSRLMRHRSAVDAALAAATLLLTLQPLCDEPWWAYLLVLAECVPLAWRRIAPFTAMLAVGVSTALHGLVPVPESALPFAAVVALYSVATFATRRRAVAALVLVCAAVPAVLLSDGRPSNLQTFTVNYVILGTAWLLGDATRYRRAATALIEQRAVAEERSRMAREMHDVVAHHVSLIVVQAEAGAAVVGSSAQHGVRAFDTIAATGREALTELRRVLGVLRGVEPAQRAPTPGLAALPRLLDGVRSAGLTVQYDTRGEPVPLPATLDRAAYRIVQESLTNALRHARSATVTVAYTADELRLSIMDDGGGSCPVPGAGTGLAGMRERAEATGGSLRAGPTPAGGWHVSANLPVEEST